MVGDGWDLQMMAELEGKRPPPAAEGVSEASLRPSSKCSSGESSPSGPIDKERFYFDSDILVLKNNPE